MLSFNEIRVFLLLTLTLNLIVIVHIINFANKGETDATEFARVFVPFLLIMVDIGVLGGIFGDTSGISFSLSITQFITSIESSVAFAFILSLLSALFIAWSYNGIKNKQFLSYSLLFSHLSLLLLAISLVTGLILSSVIPASIQDYSSIAITAVVGIAFKVLEKNDSK